MTRRRALTIIILLMLMGLLSALAGVLFGLVKLPDFITSHPLAALLLVGVLLGGLGYWLYRTQSPTELSPPRGQNRQRMLARIRTRILKQLEDSLQGATLLTLGLHEQPNAVIRFSLFSLEDPTQPAQPSPSQTHILQAYQQAEEQLLILGEPGAGKTMLLLELTRNLLDRAQQDASVPMPIVFNLASWATKRQPLGDWMVEELALIYQVPRKLGRSWIEADEIQPLLDGLDEVVEELRSPCVEAINVYRAQHGLLPTVVCSRKDDYFHQPRRLRLQSAVVVDPLSQHQIEALLSSAGESLAGLRQALATDSSLQKLAPIPLMLNLMLLAYQGLPAEEILQPSSLSTRQQQVLADYVQRRLRRRGTSVHYTSEQTLRWLSWLAGQMTKRNEKEIYLEQLQPDWLAGRKKMGYQYWSKLLNGLIFVLIFWLIFNLLNGMLNGTCGGGVIGWLFIGLAIGVFSWRERSIQPVETLSWSRHWLWKNHPLLGLVVGLVGGLVAGLLSQLGGDHLVGWVFGGTFVLFVVMDFELIYGLSRGQLTERTHLSSNEGIRRSARNGLFIGVFSGLSTGLFVWAFFGNLPAGLFMGLLIGLISGRVFGLDAALRHLVLRFWLWRAGVTPWRYVRFLNYAVDCILLRKIGGSYIFVHRLLQDYVAQLDTKLGAPAEP